MRLEIGTPTLLKSRLRECPYGRVRAWELGPNLKLPRGRANLIGRGEGANTWSSTERAASPVLPAPLL